MAQISNYLLITLPISLFPIYSSICCAIDVQQALTAKEEANERFSDGIA